MYFRCRACSGALLPRLFERLLHHDDVAAIVIDRYAAATGNPAVETREAVRRAARVGLGIDRGLAHLAVKRLQRLADVIQVEVAVNAP